MLGEEINARMDLLLESKQIKQQTYEMTKGVMEEMVKQERLDPTHESGGQFANHLAIAAERMNKKEPIEEVSEQTQEIIDENPELFEEANEILKKCLITEGAFYTKAEAGFITLYLAMFEASD